MMWSIRNRLTLMIAAIFTGLFIFLLIAGGWAINKSMNMQIERDLHEEHGKILTFMENEFLTGLTKSTTNRDQAKKRAVIQPKERYAYQTRPVIFELDGVDSRSIYAAGGLKNVHLLLPQGFFDQQQGFATVNLGNHQFRFLLSSHEWGKLAVGRQYRTFESLFTAARGLLLITFVVMMIVLFIVSRLVAKLVMKPVVDVAKVADAISLSAREMRLPKYRGEDEFAALVETLNRMLFRIEEGVQVVRQFTQDAAHELRTPLTIQRGELELLYQQEALSNQNRDVVQKVLDRAIYMSKLVDNLLLLAQADAEKYSIQKTNFQLDELLRDAAEDLEVLIGSREINVTVSAEPLIFSGDRQLINRLLFNLIDNAAKYTTVGTIKLSLEQKPDGYQLTVEDTGKGIGQADLSRIFDRFYRSSQFDSHQVKGSGLGLAISQWVVKIHGGQLKIESQLDVGTSVTVFFPQ